MIGVHAAFHDLHRAGCFVIPNPWDIGSARMLEHLGFAALATTSAGYAWSMGRTDNGVSLDECLAHLRAISASVTIPVNADFEDGFATAPDDVYETVRLATETGVAGLSIEDSTGDIDTPLLDFELSVDRMRAARDGIDASGLPILLTGRSEGFIAGRPDIDETIRRLVAYSAAGADCLYAPGIRSLEHVTAVMQAVAPKPVNVLVNSNWTTVHELASLGVRRISVGGALARVAWEAFLNVARTLKTDGSFDAMATTISGAEIERAFYQSVGA